MRSFMYTLEEFCADTSHLIRIKEWVGGVWKFLMLLGFRNLLEILENPLDSSDFAIVPNVVLFYEVN